MRWLRSPAFHLWATVVWALLIPVTLIWLRQSILWVSLLSIYANMATHWGAYEAAVAATRAEALKRAVPPAGRGARARPRRRSSV